MNIYIIHWFSNDPFEEGDDIKKFSGLYQYAFKSYEEAKNTAKLAEKNMDYEWSYRIEALILKKN